MPASKRSALCVLRSAFCIPRFFPDESGQGIIFAAAALLVLVGFVAFVFNIGRLLDRRTKVQIAADAAAYSGAMVEADAVSAIAYINSAMSQVYYNAMNYAKDVDVAAVAAELERRTNADGAPGGPAWTAYQAAYNNAQVALPQAKQWMLQLSQLENAIAIVAPRLIQEEMYAVAGRAGGERMSVYPSFRMFPSPDDLVQFAISYLGNGWQITNLTNQQTLTVTLSGGTWDLQWSGGASTREVKITQATPTSWQVQFFQPPGSLIQEVSIVNDPNLGWVVSSTGVNPNGGAPVPMQTITFTPINMGPAGGSINWVQVTQGGYSEVLGRGTDGNVYTWNSATNSPTLLTSNQTTIGGVNVQVNVTNTINFAGGGSAQIGNPTTVNLGGAHIVLNNPPTISTGFGPVWISITGFNLNQFNISAGGFSLTAGDSDGRWREHYNPTEELWWRNRLVVMGLGIDGKPNQWEYDYERLGALLTNELKNPADGIYNVVKHAFMGQNLGSDPATWPAWASTANEATPWFNTDPTVAGPTDTSWDPVSQPDVPPPAGAYYQTATVAGSQIRVSIGTLAEPSSVIHLMQTNPNAQFPGDFYLTAPMFLPSLYPVTAAGYPNDPAAYARLPLVATEDFFKWGLNIGVWKHAYNGGIVASDTPMLFPNSREPAWGTVAIASARVGLLDTAGQDSSPYVQNGHRYAFTSEEISSGARANWCSSLPNLYYADVQANLYASKNQVDNFDLDESILQGAPVTAIDESGLSYLWSAVLTPNTWANSGNNWMDQFNGQADPRVGQALSNMQNRQGATFDYGSSQLNNVVQH
jgi:Flp pilus assembly protein TadG